MPLEVVLEEREGERYSAADDDDDVLVAAAMVMIAGAVA